MSYPPYTGVFSDDLATYGEEADEEGLPWIMWFCELKSHEFFCVVDRDFIDDEFNLTGLSTMVSFYHYALDLILDLETQNSARLTAEQQRLVESSAETLYGLIHARFITTQRGLKLMEEKFAEGEFGRCPRVFCGGQAVLPVGQSDVVRESSVKLYCPKCQDIYYPRSSRHRTLDGAFWGTTFPHLFLMHLRDSGKVIAKPKQHYVPRIYGFRLREKRDASEVCEYEQAPATEEAEAGTGARAVDASVGEITPVNASDNLGIVQNCYRDPNGEHVEAPQQ
ncbi:putative dynein heavy chain [Trypanosoma rangeli]|uniref:Casein kinase II subunit beta n=1 Tax=Trypanosoma rangeli TaxID=5698 RepID=A0A3S5IQM0_TRYRA|nr:putative dynein heavy chain [Trypanosoma rangeli]RNF01065.1 putative dynein heavy chain [Trypanosoma rangeli]|eukprot:RNF01065.1 putative dynein heavy chain [Trypanosoma rangeli]